MVWRLMKNAEQHQYLNDDNNSVCNRQEALDIVLGKAITLDTLHMQYANFGCTDCNTKLIYNQIIIFALLLAYFKAGLLYQCCFFLITMLYSLKYTPTTAFQREPLPKLAQNSSFSLWKRARSHRWTIGVALHQQYHSQVLLQACQRMPHTGSINHPKHT
eukprot:12895069-Ditylum_brightwellii.AAC.1